MSRPAMRVRVEQVDVVDGMLRVDVTVPQAALRDGDETATAHTIAIPEAALDNRMAVYGLETRDAALLAVLREHAARLNGLKAKDGAAVRIERKQAKVSPAAMAMLGVE